MAASFFVFFGWLDTLDPVMATLAVSAAMIAHGALYAPQGALIAELFPTRRRYSGASLAYQATSILAGSLAPLVALGLYRSSGASWPVAAYAIASCLVSATAVLFARETRGIDLDTVKA